MSVNMDRAEVPHEATVGKLRWARIVTVCRRIDGQPNVLATGELFFALRGDNFDGHQLHRCRCRERGAAAAVVDVRRGAEKV
jgi:UDP-N-acetylmuramyl pentapeptide synthase